MQNASLRSVFVLCVSLCKVNCARSTLIFIPAGFLILLVSDQSSLVANPENAKCLATLGFCFMRIASQNEFCSLNA
jgi:hypothetical protein